MQNFSSLLAFVFLLAFGRSQRTRNFGSSYSPGGSSLAGCNGGCNGNVENRELQQLIEVNGTLYVGATNAILQLTPDLSLSSHFCNGPGNDSEICLIPLVCGQSGETCGANATCQNNYNTLLLPYRDRLLACGTLYESCDLLVLANVASIYGSASDLKCRDNTIQQHVEISSRKRSYPVVAAIYVNQSHTDSDLFFLGSSFKPFVTLLAPSSTNSYFSLIDNTGVYLNIQNVASRKPVTHLAWTTDEYAYILWSNATNPVITLSRYCIEVFSEQTRSVSEEISSDMTKGARSYTEIPLRCNVNGLSATNLISAKVVFNNLYLLFQSNNTVAICTSSVSSLNDEFNFIRRQCWNSTNGTNYARTLRERPGDAIVCPVLSSYEDYWSTCAFSKIANRFFSPIAGIVPVNVTNEMTLNLPNDEMSSGFTIGMANELVTAFIGTSSGNILKVRLGSSLQSQISEVISSGSEREYSILNSLLISEDGESLYTITKRSVYKVSVANCSQYESCNECIESTDIYCGWCIYESSCTRNDGCNDSNDDDKWIRPTLMSDLCPRVSLTLPSIISQNTRSQRLELTFAGVQLNPDLDYTCRFSVDGSDIEFQSSPLRNFTNNIAVPSFCDFALNSANIISQNRDHQNVTIDVVYNNNAVASAVIRVFSCAQVKELNNYTMCSSCASSEWGCSWCPASATCDINPTCNNDVISSNTSCPILSNFINLNSSIPVGIGRTFQILAERLSESYNDDYQCHIQTCGTTIDGVDLYVNETMVECSIAAEMLTCPFGTSELFVYLERGDDYIIDIPMVPSVQTTLFNCSAISTNTCGSCIAFQLSFSECGWCGDSCVVESQCTSMFVTDIGGCGSGTIYRIDPSSGPLEGGTRVQIQGSNLGSNVDEIHSVVVGSVRCQVIEEDYIESLEINCLTSDASSEGDSGIITVNTTYNVTIRSTDEFQFKNVIASNISSQTFLNQSIVTIMGRNLEVGSSVKLRINNASKACLSRRTPTMMSCPLPPVYSLVPALLTVMIDNFTETFPKPLEFVDIPTIQGKVNAINVFRGAGRNISIILSSFKGIHKMELNISQRSDMSKNYRQKCNFNNITALCAIPSQADLNAATASSRSKRQAQNDPAGQNSYEVTVVLNEQAATLPLGTLTYQNNPDVRSINYPCESSNAANSSVTVEILGEGFEPDDTFNGSDYDISLVVDLGSPNDPTLRCDIPFVSDTSIFCVINLDDWRRYSSENIHIEVSAGEYMFSSDSEACSINIIIYVVPVCVSLVVVLLVLIIVLMCRQRKKAKMQEKQKKLILSKLDDLENRTRETARNAYFELQVGYMENLADNLTHRIIYLSPERYFTQTLFNLSKGHPILDKTALKNESTNRMEAIKSWTALLKKRDFLMIFVRTLEEQKRFTVQEKGNMASLLTVCLFSDMPYFTNIMFDLLTELIQKHIQKNPKLLLRRSESVVEKMVAHWLSITLYDECIMEKCGEPIFLLTKAVHYLVTSGPCDVIEHKSLNSLNESTLLGAEVSFQRKVLLASIQEEEKATDPVEITVVDVDSITQVKAKIIEGIYKDRPFSECPKPDELDLEMLSGETSKEGIILSDIDSTSQKEHNYTKINSVKHYNIPEKARVVLKPAGYANLENGFGSYRLYSLSDSVFNVDSESEDEMLSPTAKTPLLNGKKSHLYHLINPKDDDSANDYIDMENGGSKKTDAVLEDLINRPFQEIYLTRMVRAKTTIQEYVDKVFKSILCPEPVPHAIRFFFQFLDREAARHRISDSEVIHIWKTNSLLLRYWVNVLKNPEFIFDINKTAIVDSCLNVITQAFMDACATTNRKLGHDSPSNKLLYAKESQQYKNMVTEFFIKTANTPWIKDEDMDELLIKTSQLYAEKFNQDVASQQLYQYLFKYKDQVLTAVRDNDREDLASEIENLMLMMDDKNSQSITTVV